MPKYFIAYCCALAGTLVITNYQGYALTSLLWDSTGSGARSSGGGSSSYYHK